MSKQKGNTLYLECYSGISGDMTVAALLDLGASEENLRRTLEKLSVNGYEIKIGRVKKSGLDACDFDVILHDEVHEHEHGHAENGKKHHHEHDHMRNEKGHHHEHRTWRDIEQILDQADLKPNVLELSKRIFRIVAEAEGKVHGCPMENVHFHEVGAVDSIVDIVAAAACLDELQVDKILVSDIWEGQGHVKCQHGILPVPVPAVLQIAASHQLPLRLAEQNGEMVTPTGAAIAALSEGKKPEKYTVERVGMGAGKRNYPRANVLRAMLIKEAS